MADQQKTRERWRSRLSAIVVSVLVLILTVPGTASADYLMRPRKTSQVGNQFHGTAPPPKISCQWIPPDHTYMCTGTNYRQALSTPDGGGLLQADLNPPSWDAANPQRFDCTGPDRAPNNVKPSDFPCSYKHRGHRHEFRMHQMLIMTDPYPPVADSITYVWPPHR
jgi:hypothetical protein